MANKQLTIYYQSQSSIEQPDGTFVTTGGVPDYATLLPLTLDGVVTGDGGGGGFRDTQGRFSYSTGFYIDRFIYNDAFEAQVLSCYGACGFSRYYSVDISYYGTIGNEPVRQYM